MLRKILFLLSCIFMGYFITSCNSGANNPALEKSIVQSKDKLTESVILNEKSLKLGSSHMDDQNYYYLYSIISNAQYNIDKRYVNISELSKLALFYSTQVIEIINNPLYKLTNINIFQCGIQLLFTPQIKTYYYEPQKLINFNISQDDLNHIIDLKYLQYQGTSSCYNGSSEPAINSQVNNLPNIAKQPPKNLVNEDNDDLKSEPDFPYFTDGYAKNHIYPKIVANPQFYKLDNPNFVPSTSQYGAVMYRPIGDVHVGFVFDEPVNFQQIADKYGVKIERHLIDPNKDLTKVKSADIGVSKMPGSPNEKVKMSLFLSSRDARIHYFPGKEIINYNEMNKYNSEWLALSVILANNAHKEQYFRQNGVVCYTFARDIILIYNALSSGVQAAQIDLTLLKLANSQKNQ